MTPSMPVERLTIIKYVTEPMAFEKQQKKQSVFHRSVNTTDR